jgi:hypothetical protein
MAKAEIQLEKQYLEAGASGLADDIGVESGFNLEWFYQNCDELVIGQLAEACKKDVLDTDRFVKDLIESNNRRIFERVLVQYKIREDILFTRVRRQLATKVFQRPGWALKYVGKKDSTVWTHQRNKRDYIILTKNESAKPDAGANDQAAMA